LPWTKTRASPESNTTFLIHSDKTTIQIYECTSLQMYKTMYELYMTYKLAKSIPTEHYLQWWKIHELGVVARPRCSSSRSRGSPSLCRAWCL